MASTRRSGATPSDRGQVWANAGTWDARLRRSGIAQKANPTQHRSPARLPPRSALCLPTVEDEELDPGDIAGLIRRQEQGRGGNFVRLGDPAQWHRSRQAGQELARVARDEIQQARSLGRARTQRVDADAASAQLKSPGAGKVAHRGLGRAINGLAGAWPGAGGRRGENDRGSVGQQGQGLLHSEDDTLDSGVQRRVDLLFGDLESATSLDSATGPSRRQRAPPAGNGPFGWYPSTVTPGEPPRARTLKHGVYNIFGRLQYCTATD